MGTISPGFLVQGQGPQGTHMLIVEIPPNYGKFQDDLLLLYQH